MSRYIDVDALVNNCDCVEALLGIELTTVRDFIKNAPTADVQPVVRGEWVEDGAVMKCSVCGNSSDYCGTENFCNYCGADMRGGWNEQIHLHYG